jgi:hypothetical protein
MYPFFLKYNFVTTKVYVYMYYACKFIVIQEKHLLVMGPNQLDVLFRMEYKISSGFIHNVVKA